jgi:hypothetical protein
MAEKALSAHSPDDPDRNERRKALARELEAKVQALDLINKELQKLVGDLREEDEKANE